MHGASGIGKSFLISRLVASVDAKIIKISRSALVDASQRYHGYISRMLKTTLEVARKYERVIGTLPMLPMSLTRQSCSTM
jgi:ATP-dependent 26S proteasome regulatory subunit